jgi:transcriptional regulator of acetoin/glycerol metabolism
MNLDQEIEKRTVIQPIEAPEAPKLKPLTLRTWARRLWGDDLRHVSPTRVHNALMRDLRDQTLSLDAVTPSELDALYARCKG